LMIDIMNFDRHKKIYFRFLNESLSRYKPRLEYKVAKKALIWEI